MMGIAIATLEREMPALWGKPTLISQLPLQEEPFTFALHAHGAMTLIHHKEVVLIKALEGYRGTSSRGIAIGSTAQDVLTHYGRPSRLLTMTGYADASDANHLRHDPVFKLGVERSPLDPAHD